MSNLNSLAWTVNSKGEVWTLQEQGGGLLYSETGFAQDIGVGADPDHTVWVITTEKQNGPGGYVTAWLDRTTKKWTKLTLPAAATRIAVDSKGTAWTVNSEGEVWTLHKPGGGELYSKTGFAQDIGVGADGTVWVITTEKQNGPGGYVTAWLDQTTKKWTKLTLPAAATRIAVGPEGTAWTVNSEGEVWTLHKPGGGELYSKTGFAQDIGVASNGRVWVITTEKQNGPGGYVTAWLDQTTKKWTKLTLPAAATQIAVQALK